VTTSSLIARLAPTAAGARPIASYRTNLVMTLLCVWFTVGLFLDAWAHNNVPGLETFFTPWHGVFYFGALATTAWVAWTVRGALRAGEHYLREVPVGYGATVIALVGFALAGVGDFTWHTIFGIEQNIEILFSPTHLGLGVSMFIIVTTPLRAMWADGRGPARPGYLALLPALLTTAFATTIVLLFLQYANAAVYGAGDMIFALANDDQGFTAQVVTAMAVTNVVLLLPVLTLARRWPLPLGTATTIYAASATLSGAVTGFDNVNMIVGLVASGVLVDLLALWLRPGPDRVTRLRAFAGLAPIVTWGVFVATAFIDAPNWLGLPQAPIPIEELYTGVPIVQGIIGLLLAFVLVPPEPGREHHGDAEQERAHDAGRR
jgi:hypothetical protein